jgi:hypothetical protein
MKRIAVVLLALAFPRSPLRAADTLDVGDGVKIWCRSRAKATASIIIVRCGPGMDSGSLSETWAAGGSIGLY